MISGGLPGLVISHLGKGLAVEDPQGVIRLCHTRRRLGDVAVGDRVLWEDCEDGQGRVMSVEPRRSKLIRPAYGGRIRVVAANIDLVCLVIACEPEPDWLLVDQVLAVCERQSINAALVVNKTDIADALGGLHESLADYERAGYACLAVSARDGCGLEALNGHLGGREALFCGQSGVGKSSLTNALLPDKQLRVGELSRKSGLGKHTTTAATLFHLPQGGHLIDSPGVAIFGLAGMTAPELAYAYREFLPHLGQCRFNDCRHQGDLGCAIGAAVADGALSAARYERYRRLTGQLGRPEFI